MSGFLGTVVALLEIGSSSATGAYVAMKLGPRRRPAPQYKKTNLCQCSPTQGEVYDSYAWDLSSKQFRPHPLAFHDADGCHSLIFVWNSKSRRWVQGPCPCKQFDPLIEIDG